MARPRKEIKEQRLERFNLRLTLSEAEHLRSRAVVAGMLPHEYARRRVVGHAIVPPPRKADADLLYELNRIGVNVNQLAKAMNAERVFRGEWQLVASELRRVLDKVAKVYGS